jgi:hypothetical protein
MTTAITYIIGGALSAFLLGYGVGYVLRALVRLIEGVTNQE